MQDLLNQVDLCFVIDTTGSMGPFLETAKQHLLTAVSELRSQHQLDLQIGLVEFRDHPPQEQSFVTQCYPLTANFRQLQQVINKLQASGGGDTPEAVYDGVRDACIQMEWRPHSFRFMLLVGDAPPHGFSGLERRHTRQNSTTESVTACLCGLTAQAVTAIAEEHRIVLHALCMGNYSHTATAFTEIANGTGGHCEPSQNAQTVVNTLVSMLTQELTELVLDRQVLTLLRQGQQFDVGQIADQLGHGRIPIAQSIARLGKRGFLHEPVTAYVQTF